MNDQTLAEIVNEIAPALVGRNLGKVYQLSARSLVLDFQPFGGKYLFLDVGGSPDPRLYLIQRRLRDLDRQSVAPSPFTILLRTQFPSAHLESIEKDAGDRIVRFGFQAEDELGHRVRRTLVAQLTGQSANLFALDGEEVILATLRHNQGPGQQTGESYVAPILFAHRSVKTALFSRGGFASWSEAADAYYQQGDAERGFAERAARLRSRLKKAIAQKEKLRAHLEQDRASHGDAEQHKRIGDLILANLTTATQNGATVTLNDYFSPDGAPIEIEIDPRHTLQEAAASRFAQYGKSKRAAIEIARRMEQLMVDLAALKVRESALTAAIESGDEAALAAFEDKPAAQPTAARPGKPEAKIPGVRRYLSSDGYEMLVGRAARDNDHLTFKIAKPNDLWLHAADYPGSHVVVRNRTRNEPPQRTIIEAAQLAANFSHAKSDNKVNINYTQRKFLSKPKGSAPGLVRLSQFRSITVEPRESGTRL